MATFREKDVNAGKQMSEDVQLRQLVSDGSGGQKEPLAAQ